MWHEILDRMTSYPAGCDDDIISRRMWCHWAEICGSFRTNSQMKLLKSEKMKRPLCKLAATMTNRIFSLLVLCFIFYSFQCHLISAFFRVRHYDWCFQAHLWISFLSLEKIKRTTRSFWSQFNTDAFKWQKQIPRNEWSKVTCHMRTDLFVRLVLAWGPTFVRL